MSYKHLFKVDFSTAEAAQLLFEAMINSIPGYVTVVNDEGAYVMANKKLLSRVGVSLEVFIGAYVGFADNNSEFQRALTSFLINSDAMAYSDVKLIKFRAHEEARWHLLTFTKVPALNLTICASIDTHEEIALSMEVHRQQEIIESSEKLAVLGEMAGGIAHEINNPMTTIDLLVGRIRRLVNAEPPKREDVHKALDTIENTVERTVKIVRSLKTFARQSKSDPMSPTSLDKIMETVSVLENDRFKHRNVQFLMDPIPDVIMDCRENEICQVLVNLINNALDAVCDLPDAWVKVTFHDSTDDIEIRVTDCGNGIPGDVVEKMMAPFFTTKEVGKGTGLGLSLSKKFIENHAGRLYYNPNWPNTQFVILLPKNISQSMPKAA